jgi:GAF domain-containing protein
MMRPPIPDWETERLADLHDLDILDFIPEQAYDDLTRIAAGICGTPIGAVTLIDSDRQWFKSQLGIDANETSRDTAFCAHAQMTPDELFIVSDAQSDARFSGNPSVTGDPHVRFYAGAPLVTQKGTARDALCVVDQPRTLEPFQYEGLRGLSRQVVALTVAAHDQATPPSIARARMVWSTTQAWERVPRRTDPHRCADGIAASPLARCIARTSDYIRGATVCTRAEAAL